MLGICLFTLLSPLSSRGVATRFTLAEVYALVYDAVNLVVKYLVYKVEVLVVEDLVSQGQ